MFGLSWLEIGLVVLVLILVFGGRRVGHMMGRSYDAYRKVDETRRAVRKQFSLSNLLGLDKDKTP
jgi:Sec-independent protein translocase protein TatA